MSTPDSEPQQHLIRLQSYLAQDPANEPLRRDIFERALALGQFDLAQTVLEAALSTRPDDPVWRHYLGTMLLARGDFSGAERALRRLIDAGYDHPAIVYNLAWAIYSQQRWDAALEVLLQLVQHDDVPPRALYLTVRCLHFAGRLEEGVKLMEEHEPMLGEDDDVADSFGAASLLAFDAERIDLAQRWAGRALAYSPRQLEALTTRGTLALGMQDIGAAERDLNLAVELQPKAGRAWSALAFCHLSAMRLDRAREDFQRAVEHMPGHIGTWIGLGWCALISNDAQAAHAAFTQALELDRNFGESHGGLAVVQALQGDVAEAELSIQRALGLDKRNISARFAQSILSGEASQQDAIKRLAMRLLEGRTGIDGRPMIESVLRERS